MKTAKPYRAESACTPAPHRQQSREEGEPQATRTVGVVGAASHASRESLTGLYRTSAEGTFGFQSQLRLTSSVTLGKALEHSELLFSIFKTKGQYCQYSGY